jgi:hypothetical protein
MSNIHPADALGALKAQIADLEIKAKIEHAKLVALGAGAHDGDLFRATVSVADRNTIDWESIAKTLKPSLKQTREYWSPQTVELVDGNTATKPVTTVRVAARRNNIAA